MNKPTAPFSTGERLVLEIEGLNHAGEGVGRAGGFTVFVPWSAPGDKLEAEVTSLQKSYARALPRTIVRSSLSRQEPPCPYHGRCGGCQLQHINYSEQLSLKQEIVSDALQRLGGLNIPVLPVIGMDNPWHYRNRAQYPVAQEGERLKVGFFERRSHEVVDVRRCLIQHRAGQQAVEAARELIEGLSIPAYDHKKHRGLLRHLLVRSSFISEEVLIVLVTNGSALPAGDRFVAQLAGRVKNLVGIVQNINRRRGNVVLGKENLLLWGRDYLLEELGELRFQVSATAFFQVNSRQAEVLFELVRDYAELRGEETVLDLYCGSGAISLFLSGNAARVIGIESYAPAVEDARKNARLNAINNVEFHAGRAEQLLPAMAGKGYRAEVAVLDPPRKGCENELLAALVKIQPRRIIYVSCNPATLARDLRYLAASGYNPVKVQPVDMFPHTAHCEAVARIDRTTG